MNECSVCEKDFEDKFFDETQGKCILHCDKKDKNQLSDLENFNEALVHYIADYYTHKHSLNSFLYNVTSKTEREKNHKKNINIIPNNLTNNKEILKESENKKIIMNDIKFPLCGLLSDETNYVSVLNKLMIIEFKNCDFKDKVEFKNDTILRFKRCHFFGEWEHIFCNEIEYLNCEFEDFIIHNIAEKKLLVENHMLYDCGFKNINCEGVIFKKRFFKYSNVNKYIKINNLSLVRCEFKDDFILNITNNEYKKDIEYFNISNLDLTHSIFHTKVKIQFCNIEETATFYNTKFKDLADFYNTKFNEVIFERIDFEKVAVFSEVKFLEDVNFKYAKFLDYSVFRDTVIKGRLNLRDTIFGSNADANFLDITSQERKKDDNEAYYGQPQVIEVANRETARLIKSFYEYSNNIIEANKFYALEMQMMENELSFEDNPREWLVFKAHSLFSVYYPNKSRQLFQIPYYL